MSRKRPPRDHDPDVPRGMIRRSHETAAQQFARLARARLMKAERAIGRLGHLADRGRYDYTPAHVRELFGRLALAFDHLRHQYQCAAPEAAERTEP